MRVLAKQVVAEPDLYKAVCDGRLMKWCCPKEAQVQRRQYPRLPTLGPPEPNACCGSAVPVWPLELRTYPLHPMPSSAARPWATALENERLRTAVGL